ncbi:MAG: IS110 family transposase [candidate division Zixibacteria bacterium]
MGKSVFYFGIDVGASELWISSARTRPRKFNHNKAGIKALCRWSIKQSDGAMAHLCMEATGVYSRHVAIQLYSLSDVEVSIVNPARIKAFANVQMRRSKTDMIDAEVIRCFAESQHPAVWQPTPTVMRQLYQLVVHAEALQQSLMQWRNRKHAHQFTDDLPSAVAKSQRAIERSLTRQLQNIEDAIGQLCATDAELARQVDLLESIPGIARKSATRILAFGGDWLTQRTQKQLIAHAGLAPHHHQSGTSVRGKSRIDKRGNRRLRKTLFMPALTGIVNNPSLNRFYQNLLKKGKTKMTALVASMKKLLIIIQAILKKKIPFDPNFALDS